MSTILVTLDLNGCTGAAGAVIASPVTATVGDRFDVAVTFSVEYWKSSEGYWIGWFTDAGSEVLASHTVPVSDITLHARVVLYEFGRVSFDANGGNEVSPGFWKIRAGRSYTSGSVSLPTPTHPNAAYVFAGWWTTPSSGGVRVYNSSLVPVGDYTLYARWEVPYEEPSGYWERTEEDASWVIFDKDVFMENLPVGLSGAVAVWSLSSDAKEDRVDFIVSGVLLDFRSAVDAAAHPVGAANTTAIPVPCLRHMQMMCWYLLGVECGYSGVDDLRPGWQDAEVYLRSLVVATRMGANRFAYTGADVGVPRYSAVDGIPVSGGSGSPLLGSGVTGGEPSYGHFVPG